MQALMADPAMSRLVLDVALFGALVVLALKLWRAPNYGALLRQLQDIEGTARNAVKEAEVGSSQIFESMQRRIEGLQRSVVDAESLAQRLERSVATAEERRAVLEREVIRAQRAEEDLRTRIAQPIPVRTEVAQPIVAQPIVTQPIIIPQPAPQPVIPAPAAPAPRQEPRPAPQAPRNEPQARFSQQPIAKPAAPERAEQARPGSKILVRPRDPEAAAPAPQADEAPRYGSTNAYGEPIAPAAPAQKPVPQKSALRQSVEREVTNGAAKPAPKPAPSAPKAPVKSDTQLLDELESLYAAAEDLLRAGKSLEIVADRTSLPMEEVRMLSQMITRRRMEEQAEIAVQSDPRLGVLGGGIRRQTQVL